jgi:hypothetical protein
MIAPMNYRRAVKLCLVTIALAGFGWTQDAPNNTLQTDGMWNGRAWVGFTGKNEKTIFLMGYQSGLKHLAIAAAFDQSKPSAERLALANQLVETCWPTTLTYGEIQLALDRFYDTPENRPMAISTALSTISARVQK